MRPPIMTFVKTSQGPPKSMRTAPSEIRQATGIDPWAGGLSLLSKPRGLPVRLNESVRSASARDIPESENGIAVMKPSAADCLSNSLRFIGNLLEERAREGTRTHANFCGKANPLFWWLVCGK